MSRPRIRLVLFDAFDTLITPRLPIHRQYAEEACRAGLINISEDDVRRGFKIAFPALNAQHPLYGLKSTPPLTVDEWWSLLIEQTMVEAGAGADDVQKALSSLGPRLLERFSSSEGYRAFDDVLPALKGLQALGVEAAVLSNADSRILKVLDSLALTPHFTSPPTLNYTCGFSKPDARIFQAACSQARGGGVRPEEALMVGDELEADYLGSEAAGLHGALIRRDDNFSDGAKRAATEDLEGIRTIRSLEELVEIVRVWNEGCGTA